MRKLIFCALLCLAGSMKLYATDVVGGTHVTLPTLPVKTEHLLRQQPLMVGG